MNYRTAGKENEIIILDLEGRIDAYSSLAIEEDLNKKIGEGSSKLIINLKEVSYMSSSGLRVLLSALKKVTALKGNLKLVNLQPAVHKVFKLDGLTNIFRIFQDEEEAIADF